MRIGQTSFTGFVSQFSASVVGFIATIYITRNLGSAVFGEYMLVIALVIWLQVIGILGIENAVTKRLSETGESDPYLTTGAGLVLAAFVVLSVVVLTFSKQVNSYIGEPVAVYILGLLLAGMAFKFVTAALSGQHKVHVAALLQPVDRTVRSVLQILAVFFGLGLVGLLAGYVIAGIVATLVGLVYLSVGIELPERRHLKGITSYARYAWLGKFSSRAFSSMDTVVLGLFVTSSYIGYYEVAWNLASMLAIFSVAIAQALFPEMSRAASEGDPDRVGSFVADGLSYTGLFLIPGLVGSLLVGDLVLRVYGNEFQQATTVLVVLVVARLVYEYGNQFLNGLNGLDRPDLAFRVNAVFVIANVGLNVSLIAAFGWTGAAIATALSAVVTAVFAYRSFTHLVSVDLPLIEISKQWIAAAGMAVVVYAGRLVLPNRVLVGVALVGVGAVSYLLLLVVLSGDFRATVRRNLPLEA
ncbi:oligosaccharide flippase family protein [Halorarum halophilum]|uniref:Oligosaccharide flippase family protein n=1 Tax=Halorarum halophilum TaxID=2743090 RepID=A0A7D5KJS9_9EURY|nr:oligosaccharide flippase family protein [Halobaculum halophilum]QLG26095.1 oligosaccharide flippase family protein [Halobaculum halophilum]